jgi:tRNA dimethylallyltransferase
MAQKTCIIIAGPTGVGKTSLAVSLARKFSTSIISADSRQCFRELTIGVAKPSPEQLAAVKHYFIDTHSITEPVSAGLFEAYALQAVTEIFRESDVAIVAGGTGLYIRAFCEGMDPIPAVAPHWRDQISAGYATGGLRWLQQQVEVFDPGWLQSGEVQNPHRLMRALEVVMATGKSIRSFQSASPVQRHFRIIKIALGLPVPALYRQINERTDRMMQDGLVAEARGLLPFRNLPALQTVGYTELFDCFENNGSIGDATALISQHTRNYAKRQLTWFRKDANFTWFSPFEYELVSAYLTTFMK